MVNIYREADRRRMERTNAESHLMGMYIYEALCDVSPILHAFAKNGAKPIEYRTEPYPLFGKEVLSRIMRKLVCRLWLDEVSQQ